MEVKTYTRMPYCALCGEKFSSDIIFRSIIPVEQYGGLVLTGPLGFRGTYGTVIVQELNISIDSPKFRRSITRLAPSIHSFCWSAMSSLPSLRSVYDLGLAMSPLMWKELPQSIYTHYSIAARDLLHPTSLQRLLKHISNLPLELVDAIWSFMPPSATRCLFSLSTSRRIWPGVDANPGSATIQLQGVALVYLTSMMDGVYITGVCIDDRVYGYQSNQSRKLSFPSSAAAFTFTLGRYGLRQLGILPEATKAPFDRPALEGTEYLGVIYSDLPPRMELTWDTLKVSRVNWALETDIERGFGQNFLWVSPWLPRHQYTFSASSFYEWPRHHDFALQTQRFMAYIPLCKDGHRLSALTAFCFLDGIIGLGTFFESCSNGSQSVSWYGQQDGCPVHIRLGQREVLKSISVAWGKTDTPYLAIATNQGRNLILGPYMSPGEIQTRTLYTGSDKDITALYYDISPGLAGFTSMGVIGRPGASAQRVRQHHDIKPYMPLDFNHLAQLNSSPWTSFSSQGSLINIKKLKLCFLGSHCTGMLLIYDDDSASALGQWYEGTSDQADIFDLDYRPNHILKFSLVEPEGHGHVYVGNIMSIPASDISDITETDIIYGDDIIWLYALACDIILRVPGLIQD
ncbi:hypothetical protein BDV25DRAFT_167797 [Aspergillus avenaceus]|uniref:Uncharacterized protein n=1 Tax=Aspergillus avenaceus TaxID=36643 RepID=A0A5N6U609_ASPAV|nr:hypothetical protein BDV25DRAFT_167797 [Aspergillus avenaceus]